MICPSLGQGFLSGGTTPAKRRSGTSRAEGSKGYCLERPTMNRLKIGIRVESLGLPLRRALQEAERLGVGGVQVDAVGDLTPAKPGETGRRELRRLLRAHNLELTALGCPLRRGLDTAQDLEPRIDRVRQVMTLSYDLGARVAIVQAGQIPEDAASPRAQLLGESLLALGQCGDR